MHSESESFEDFFVRRFIEELTAWLIANPTIAEGLTVQELEDYAGVAGFGPKLVAEINELYPDVSEEEKASAQLLLTKRMVELFGQGGLDEYRRRKAEGN